MRCWMWESATFVWDKPPPLFPVAKPNVSNSPQNSPAEAPVVLCTFSTNQQPACTSPTSNTCWRCWVDWSTPATILEKIIRYEAVHEIRSWSDLKNRLDSDRRCYALFPHRMPNEPLILVEVALVHGLSSSVQALLDKKAPLLDPKQADTAIFYSISNCQKGLSGISFGNFLIKRVVDLLSDEFRNVKTFATLSPIPGFRHWLDAKLALPDPYLLSAEESTSLRAAAPRHQLRLGREEIAFSQLAFHDLAAQVEADDVGRLGRGRRRGHLRAAVGMPSTRWAMMLRWI